MKAQSTDNAAQSSGQAVVLESTILSRVGPVLRSVPVSGGLCVSRGQLTDVSSLRVEGFAVPVVAQAEVLNRWSDGSVKWFLASFVAPELAGRRHDNIDQQQQSEDSDIGKKSVRLIVDRRSSADTMDAESTLTTVKYESNQLLVSIRREQDSGPCESTIRIRPRITAENGRQLSLVIDSIREVVSGPVRRVFVLSGRLKTDPQITVQFRMTHWVQLDSLQLDARIRNSRRAKHSGGLWDLGDAGSVHLRSFVLDCSSEESGTTPAAWWKAETDQPFRVHSSSA